MEAATVYARHEHGGYPVHLQDLATKRPKFTVEYPTGPELFESGRALMRALYGKESAPHITVVKYFRLDTPPPKDEVSIFDLLDTPVPEARIPLVGHGTTTKSSNSKPSKLIMPRFADVVEVQRSRKAVKTARKRAPKQPPKHEGLGIDLYTRAHEVRKLLFAGFGARIYRSGYDPEDVLQEVYRGILARNHGTCPWDPAKSSFGHYVHMVCECILNNYHRKQKRIRTNEKIGMHVGIQQGGLEDFGMENDVALGAVNEPDLMMPDPDADVRTEMARNGLLEALYKHGRCDRGLRPDAELAIKALPLVEQGMRRTEIADELGVSSGRAGKALAFLRRTTEAWAMETGLRDEESHF